MMQKYWAAIIAGAGFSIGLTALAVGYIVRAIYFVDGADSKIIR